MSFVDVFIDRYNPAPWFQICIRHPDWMFFGGYGCTDDCGWLSGTDCLNCESMEEWATCPCLHTVTDPDLHAIVREWRMQLRKRKMLKWVIVHPTANLQHERNFFRAAQLWKVLPVSELLTLVGTFYSAGITVGQPVKEG